MADSPRLRRLRNDLAALEALSLESSIFSFVSKGDPPFHYELTFNGTGLWRPEGGEPTLRQIHKVKIELGANYPRMMPAMKWDTPFFHPNVSASGTVCLGGYGTHWVPSLKLDELCNMLWDMIRYANFDTESPYNREAALWTKTQNDFPFPLDKRSLRDLAAANTLNRTMTKPANDSTPAEILFVDEDVVVVDAEIVNTNQQDDGGDILFID